MLTKIRYGNTNTVLLQGDESQAQVVLFEESRKFLGELGIEGEIISTPSHSEDSISVILDDGTCIVGDLYAHANERTF